MFKNKIFFVIKDSYISLKAERSMVRKPLLDGMLVCFIDKAENLQFPLKSQNECQLQADVFVSGRIGPTILFKTRAIKNSANPVWHKKFRNSLHHEADYITINVRNLINDLGGSSEVASVKFPCDDIIKGSKIDGWFDLQFDNKEVGRIKMSLEYHSKEEIEKMRNDKVTKD